MAKRKPAARFQYQGEPPVSDFVFCREYCKLGHSYFPESESFNPVNWTSVAILSAAIFGVINVIDSHLISKRMPSLRAFLLPLTFIHTFYGLLFLYLFPFPDGIGWWPLTVAFGSAIIRIAGATIMLYYMKKEEISRVVPIVYSYPIFVALIAMPLLGESLSYAQWLAIVIVVAGAVIISFRQSPFGSTHWLGKSFLALVGSSLLLAMADIASKYALTYVSFWNMFSVNAFCIVGVFSFVSFRPHIFRQLKNMKHRNRTLGLQMFNETLTPIAITTSYWALSKGPVSLVSTLVSTRPIFVVIYALILGRFLPNFLVKSVAGRVMMMLRLAAITMIVGGIAIIYLS
jgi:drug/metabolite transporter (DMT)-like permease